MGTGTLDLSKYASPALIHAIQSVTDFLGECIKDLILPPVFAIVLTFLLGYFLPFKSDIAWLLFLSIGVIGGAISGFLFGLSQFVNTALQDVKNVMVETTLLIKAVVDDIAMCAGDPSNIPPLSDLIQGVVNSVILPVVHQIFRPKLYGGLALLILDPLLRKSGNLCASFVSPWEKRLKHTNLYRSDSEQQHDSQGNLHERGYVAKNVDAILKKKQKMVDLMESLTKKVSNGIDKFVYKVDIPLRISTFLGISGTVLSMLVVWAM